MACRFFVLLFQKSSSAMGPRLSGEDRSCSGSRFSTDLICFVHVMRHDSSWCTRSLCVILGASASMSSPIIAEGSIDMDRLRRAVGDSFESRSSLVGGRGRVVVPSMLPTVICEGIQVCKWGTHTLSVNKGGGKGRLAACFLGGLVCRRLVCVGL